MFETQKQENRSLAGQNSPYATKGLSWKWEKRHCLLIIAGVCLLLWFFSSSLKETNWVRSSLNYLPMIGGLALVGEQLLRLVCL